MAGQTQSLEVIYDFHSLSLVTSCDNRVASPIWLRERVYQYKCSTLKSFHVQIFHIDTESFILLG